MLNCSIAVADRNSMYVDQIIAGFTLLAKENHLTFTLAEKPDLKKEFFHSAIIEVLVDGKGVIYDLIDGYNNYPSFKAIDDMLDNVDFYLGHLCVNLFIAICEIRIKYLSLPQDTMLLAKTLL